MKIFPRTFLKKSLTVLGIVILFSSIHSTARAVDPAVPPAQPAYQPLSPITIGNTPIRTDLTGFIIDAVRIAIAASAALAILMIILGGLQYMSTDSVTGSKEGRKRINQALIGLPLVMISFLVLQTINPNIVKIGLLSSDLGTTPGGNTGGNPNPTPITSNPNPTNNAQLKRVQYKTFSIQALKDENVSALSDSSFYGFTIPASFGSPTMIIQSNFTQSACQFARSSYSNSHPGIPVGDCVQSRLQ